MSDSATIAANLDRVRSQIAAACAHAHRDPATVALMAVSKTHPASAIAAAHAAGQRLFGENRVQEFATKASELFTLYPQGSMPFSFHLIGPLQNNKTTRAAELFDAVDSIDSLKTAQRLNTTAQALGKTLDISIEVKLSPEDSKHGLAPEALPELLAGLAPLTHIRPTGLMTVPPYTEDPAGARPYFARLRQLRDQSLATCPTLTGLSMGMSHDFHIAIEEGSTVVRIGTAIFGTRTYP